MGRSGPARGGDTSPAGRDGPVQFKIRPTGLAEGRSANPVDRSLMVTAFSRCALVELQTLPGFVHRPCTTTPHIRHVFGEGDIVCGLVLVAAS